MSTTTAISLLKDDHKKVKTLLEDLIGTGKTAPKKRERLLKMIKVELEIHTKIEEEIFYPAFREKGEEDELAMFYEATEEHRIVDSFLLPDLLATNPASERFSGRAKILKELVEHHADEEENEMFPIAQKLFSKEELVMLGENMEILKKELMNKKEVA